MPMQCSGFGIKAQYDFPLVIRLCLVTCTQQFQPREFCQMRQRHRRQLPPKLHFQAEQGNEDAYELTVLHYCRNYTSVKLFFDDA